MDNYEYLFTELEEIKKQLSFLTKNQDSPSSPSQPTGDDWITLYDGESDDPALNLGHPTIIHGSTGQIESFPDLATYTKLKVLFTSSGEVSTWEYDITSPKSNTFKILTASRTISSIIGMSFVVQYIQPLIFTGKRIISFANCTKIDIFSTKLPVLTDLKTNQYFGITKILAK